MKDDVISRQAAKLKVAKVIWEDGDSCYDFHDKCVDCLDDVPPAQPEIIYCKKCKHWTRTCGDEQWGLGDCDVFDKHLVMCNGYCAWAERQEE